MKHSSALIIGLALIIIIATIGVFILSQNKFSNEIKASEGNVIAEQLALNWSDNATLVHITGKPQEAFAFRYWDTTNNAINCMEVTVYANKTTQTRLTRCLHDEYPISNWTIDSDEAYNIAMNNDKIKSFMRHNPALDSFSLASPTTTGNSVWYIHWAYNASIDDPKWAQIQIDANTGEVLYVEADY